MKSVFDRIAEGETHLIFDYVKSVDLAKAVDAYGVSIMQWCFYYGDVSAIRFLLCNGETLDSLGDNFDLNGAVFHGFPQLTQFLIDNGADVNCVMSNTGESPLHAALCTTDRKNRDPIIKILLANGANPNCKTIPGVETDAFMRDVRTRGETPLHRAAAYGNEETITMLIDANAQIDAKDINGDTPLTWASWHLRPRSILRLLCYGNFRA
ncbi:MAG: ankyrin repeat domain-containing protein [Pirellula sp.]|jgi:ankyrin repeat protein